MIQFVPWVLLLTGATLVGLVMIVGAVRTARRAQRELRREIDRSLTIINQRAKFLDRLGETGNRSGVLPYTPSARQPRPDWHPADIRSQVT